MAVSTALPDDVAAVRTLLESVAKQFPDVQYFASHRVVEYHSWARASNGKLIRHYAFVGDRGETLCDLGDPTNDEKNLGLVFKDRTFPNEQHVMKLASAWSIDPTALDQLMLERSLGHLGSLEKK